MGKEQRAFARHAVRWQAEVCTGDGATLDMEIRDFCEGGVFLVAATRTAAASLKRSVDHGATVALHVAEPLSGQHTSVLSRVAHVSRTGLGLSFHDPAPAMVTGLMAVNSGRTAPRRRAGEPATGTAAQPANREAVASGRDAQTAKTGAYMAAALAGVAALVAVAALVVVLLK